MHLFDAVNAGIRTRQAVYRYGIEFKYNGMEIYALQRKLSPKNQNTESFGKEYPKY